MDVFRLLRRFTPRRCFCTLTAFSLLAIATAPAAASATASAPTCSLAIDGSVALQPYSTKETTYTIPGAPDPSNGGAPVSLNLNFYAAAQPSGYVPSSDNTYQPGSATPPALLNKSAPTVLIGDGYALAQPFAATSDALSYWSDVGLEGDFPGLQPASLLADGYNVVTWDSRGEILFQRPDRGRFALV
jgi:hypothetical protein